MPRNCSCAGSSCSCLVQAGPGATVSGSGNADDPYIVGFGGAGFLAIDSPGGTIDLADLGLTSSLVLSLNIAGDVTLVMSSPPAGTRIDILFTHVDGPWAITVPSEILFPGGTNPTLVGPDHDWLTLIFNGVLWFGFARANMA